MSKPLVLISNDDGVQANGIKALAEAFAQTADVWVVAPDRERSATSHSISLHKPLRIRQLAAQEFCVDGTPTDSVYLGVHHILKRRPDIVISGINHGPNLGSDVLYSGTISAAMEGALLGCRAVAVSLDLPESGSQSLVYFQQAAEKVHVLVNSLLKEPMPHGVLLNVNVPYLPKEKLRGFKLCRLGVSDWQHTVISREDPRGRPYYWIGGERHSTNNTPDSDYQALQEGFIAVTPVHYDLTDHRSFAFVRQLNLQQHVWEHDNLGDSPLPHPHRVKL